MKAKITRRRRKVIELYFNINYESVTWVLTKWAFMYFIVSSILSRSSYLFSVLAIQIRVTQRSFFNYVTNRFTLLFRDVEVTKALGVPSLLTRRAHTYLLFFRRLLLGLSGLPLTTGLNFLTTHFV